VGILAGSTAFAQAIALAALPLATRLYTPSDFGLLVVFLSSAALIQVGSSLCFPRAIPLPTVERTALALAALSLLILAAFTGLTALGLFLAGDRLLGWLQAGELAPYAWVVPLGLLAIGGQEILSMLAVRQKSFGAIARSKVHQSLGTVTAQSALGFVHLGAIGLLLGDVAGRLAGIVALLRRLAGTNRADWAGLRWTEIAAAASQYRRFAILSTPSAFLNRAAASLPLFLMAAVFGPEAAGWLAFSERALRTPMALLGQSVAQVYLGEAARLRSDDPAGLYRLFCRTAWRMLWIGLGPIGLTVVVAPGLFAAVFGDEWRQAGVFAQFLGAAMLLEFVVSPLSQTLNVLERQDLQLAWDLLLFGSTAGAIAACCMAGLSASATVLTYAGALSAVYLVQILLLRAVLRRHTAAGNETSQDKAPCRAA
jgi:O-antigen/teichoic acid export membrane protein